MDTIETYILKVRPDPKTGKMPTEKQLKVLLLLARYRGSRGKSYSDVATVLGITLCSVRERMRTFSKNCPELWKNFKKARFIKPKKRKKKFLTGCVGCGCSVPDNQELCFSCWREADRLKNPELYNQDPMFPVNGKTRSTIEWDKDAADRWMQFHGYAF